MRRHHLEAGFCVALALLPAACGELPVEPVLQTRWPDVRPWVTGDALAALDAEGHFVFPVPEQAAEESLLHPSEALALGVGYLDTYVRNPRVHGNLAATAEREHGAPIDWPDVKPLPNAPFLGLAPQMAPEDVAPELANFFGPQYVLLYRVYELFVLVGSVAAHATYLEMRTDGTVTGLRANEFTTDGIPRSGTFPAPMTAEHAVAALAERTETKVTQVPTYILPPAYRSVSAGYWRMVLDRKVPVQLEEGGVVRVDTLYVRHEWIPSGNHLDNTSSFFIPGPQPDSIPVTYPVMDDSGGIVLVQDTFATNPSAPIRYLRVFPIAF